MVGTYLPTYPPFGWMNSGWTGLVTFGWILVGLVWSLLDEFWLDTYGWILVGLVGSLVDEWILVGLVWSLVDEFWLDWFGHLWMNPGWTLVDEFWLDWFGHFWMNSGWTGLVTCGWNSGWTGWALLRMKLLGIHPSPIEWSVFCCTFHSLSVLVV
jgi:hypothetical protein